MPRLQLTDDEVKIIEARRRKNAEAIAHNRAIGMMLELAQQVHDDFPQVMTVRAVELMKERALLLCEDLK